MIPESPEQFTTDWLTDKLGAPQGSLAGFSVKPIGTGQIADSHRITLEWAQDGHGPKSVVVKCPSADETSRSTAIMMKLYEHEVRWYLDIAPDAAVQAPHCYHAEIDDTGGLFSLILEDCAPGVQGDQLEGASLDQIRSAIDEAALLHGHMFDDPALASIDWLQVAPEEVGMRKALHVNFWPAFKERYATRLSADVLAMGDEYAKRLEKSETPEPAHTCLSHNDFRIDNMLFGRADGRVVVLDWQTLSVGAPVMDVSYLIGTSITDPAQRRAEEEALVRHYHEKLLAAGAIMQWDQVWQDYRLFAVGGFSMAVIASMLAQRTERGDEMFAVMAERPAQQIIDLDSLSLL